MTDEYEQCRTNITILQEFYQLHTINRNEATTRLQLIDRLFFDCLLWSRDDVISEESHEGQYADYVFHAPRRIMIVEAKREGDYFDVPAGKNNVEYSIKSISKDNPNLKSALEQVSRYCQDRGVPLGVVCNGHQLVAYVATRNDGNPPLEGTALVFPSIQFMIDHFLDLWQALSKPGIEDKIIQKRLLGSKGYEIPPKLSASIYGYPGIKDRNIFQTDLQIVSEIVLEDIPNSKEYEHIFLSECYCQSGALSQYSVVSKEILKARYAALFDEDSYDLDAVPATEKKGLSSEFLAASLSRRPILIIGNVGVGKTTFIRYLHKIDAAELVKDAVVLYLDLGSKITLAGDLNEHMLNEFFRQLLEEYDIDIEERNFVRGIYNIDLQRFRKGVYSDLIDINPNQFIEKEVEFLNKKVQDKGQHIQRVLNHIVKGRKKQVVIFIDNADQRDYELQQNAFLIAQELAEHTFSTVFITLRPETYHRSRKMGTLSGYHSKAFTISPPRIDRVINKRLSFARKITSGEISIASLTHLRLENLDSIIRVFIESLERDRSLIQFIDNISGGNVRLALDIVKGFFSSGHVDTEKIIDVYQYSGKYFVPLHEMVRAVIYGDSEHYNPSQSPVPNLYDISSSDIKEHFLLPIILCLLTTVPIDGEHQGFMETDLIYEYCQGLGFSPEQIDSALTRASRYNAIEFSTRRIPEYDQLMPKSARATSMGAYLVFDLCRFFSYFDAIIVDTPIVDRKIRQLLENVRTIEDRLSRANIFLEYLDSAWDKSNLAEKDIQYNWERVSTELKQEITHIRERIESRNSFIS